MEQKSVLITDDCHMALREGLAEMGYRVDFEPEISYAEAKERIGDYEGLIINSKILVDREFLDRAVRLKFVGRLGSGMEIVDKVYAKQKGVKVCSSPEGNRNAVAEHALGMLLALANNLLQADAEVRQYIWEREARRGWELEGKTVGIIGFGHTGSSFAKLLKGFDVKVLVYDKYSQSLKGLRHVRRSSLEEIQCEADVISFHLPLTEETKDMARMDFFEACKKGVVIINTSRGKVLRLKDLVEALETGRVGGACLDVFENEKPATYTAEEKKLLNKLFAFRQVVLSPHIAGWTQESKLKMAQVLLVKIRN